MRLYRQMAVKIPAIPLIYKLQESGKLGIVHVGAGKYFYIRDGAVILFKLANEVKTTGGIVNSSFGCPCEPLAVVPFLHNRSELCSRKTAFLKIHRFPEKLQHLVICKARKLIEQRIGTDRRTTVLRPSGPAPRMPADLCSERRW